MKRTVKPWLCEGKPLVYVHWFPNRQIAWTEGTTARLPWSFIYIYAYATLAPKCLLFLSLFVLVRLVPSINISKMRLTWTAKKQDATDPTLAERNEVSSISKWSLQQKTTFLWGCFRFERSPVCSRNAASWKETLQSKLVLHILREYCFLKNILCFWNRIHINIYIYVHILYSSCLKGVLHTGSGNDIGNFTLRGSAKNGPISRSSENTLPRRPWKLGLSKQPKGTGLRWVGRRH